MRVPRHQGAGNRAAASPEDKHALTKDQSRHLLSSLTLLPPSLSFFPPFLPSKVLFPLGPGRSFEEEISEPTKTNFNKLKMSVVPKLNRGQLGSPSYGQSLVDPKSALFCLLVSRFPFWRQVMKRTLTRLPSVEYKNDNSVFTKTSSKTTTMY